MTKVKNSEHNIIPKLFNQRPLFLMLLFFIIGTVACRQTIFGCIVLFCLAAFCAFLLYTLKQIDTKTLILCLIVLCLSLEYFGVIRLYESRLADADKNTQISGKVIAVDEYNDTLLLDELSFDGIRYKGLMLVQTDYRYIYATEGDIIKAKGTITTYNPNDDYELHNICKGIYYHLEPSSLYKKRTEEAEPRSAFVAWVKQSIQEVTDRTTAEFAVSMLFGANALDKQTKVSYQSLGAAHVFAVSGLHMSVLSSIIFAFYKLIKVSRKFSMPAIILIMGAYCWLCRFSPSVLRACLMTAFILGAKNRSICPDKLSVFSGCALLSLIIKPLWLFDVSFLLSYAAVFGIFTLYSVMLRLISKVRIFNKIKSALALDCAVCISLLPLTIYYFEGFSLISVLTSLFVIPLISIAFGILLFTIPLLAAPYLSFLPLTAVSLLIKAITFAVSALASLDLFVSVTIVGAMLPLWYTAIILFSDITFLSKKLRYSLGGSLMGFSVILMI